MSGFGTAIGAGAIRGIASAALGKTWSGVGAVGRWLASLDLVHILLLILALFGGYQTLGRWMQHRHTVKVEGQLSAANKALAGARADLATSRANEAGLKKAIADQNAAIADLGAQSAKAQQIAGRAAQAASQRAGEAESTSERLRQSSRSAPGKTAPAAPCEPSDTLKGQWR